MKKYLFLGIFIFYASAMTAQGNQNPCAAPETSQFDFWVGEWTLYTADTITGTNSINKVMDGCTV